MIYFWYAAVLVTAIAAVTDWRTGHIPNELTFSTRLLGLVARCAYGGWIGGMSGALQEGGIAFLGATLCALAPVILFFQGGIGGGDVKLFAGLGALCSPLGGIAAEGYTFLGAMVFALARLAYDGTLLRTLKNTVNLVLNPFRKKEQRKEMPPELMTWFRLGPFIFAGTVLAFLQYGPWH
jgi:prepilin peptidase CpaA